MSRLRITFDVVINIDNKVFLEKVTYYWLNWLRRHRPLANEIARVTAEI